MCCHFQLTLMLKSVKMNRYVDGNSHTHRWTLKSIWTLFLQAGLAGCRSGKLWLGFVWILSLRTYSLLFPLRSSPLSSSPHLMLWVPVENSLLLFPLGSVFSSLSPFPRWRTCFTDVPAERFFLFSSFLLCSSPAQLSDIHPLCSGCALAFERTAGAAGQHRGKGGVEGWRKQGGVDVGHREVVSGHGIPERNLKCVHRADREQD